MFSGRYTRYEVSSPSLSLSRPFPGYLDNHSSHHIPLVRTDFFDNIFVEAEELPDGCQYDHNEQLWVWESENGPLYWDIHETVRLAVTGEEWNDQTPTKPAEVPDEDAPQEVKLPPYIVKGSMKSEGLGCTLWWEL